MPVCLWKCQLLKMNGNGNSNNLLQLYRVFRFNKSKIASPRHVAGCRTRFAWLGDFWQDRLWRGRSHRAQQGWGHGSGLQFHWIAGIYLKDWDALLCAFVYCPVTLAGLDFNTNFAMHELSAEDVETWLKKLFPGCSFTHQGLNGAVLSFHCLCLWDLHFELDRSLLKLMFSIFNW